MYASLKTVKNNISGALDLLIQSNCILMFKFYLKFCTLFGHATNSFPASIYSYNILYIYATSHYTITDYV